MILVYSPALASGTRRTSLWSYAMQARTFLPEHANRFSLPVGKPEVNDPQIASPNPATNM